MLRAMRMRLGGALRAVARFVLPDYWVCTGCGKVEWREQEVMCWGCGAGEMAYRGDKYAAAGRAKRAGAIGRILGRMG